MKTIILLTFLLTGCAALQDNRTRDINVSSTCEIWDGDKLLRCEVHGDSAKEESSSEKRIEQPRVR